jgi:hypothetical protein
VAAGVAGIAQMAMTSAAAITSGASWQQVLKGDAIALGGMLVGLGAPADASPLARVLGGAVGGGVTAIVAARLTGGKLDQLGQNALAGATTGAVGAGVGAAVQGQNPLSLRTAAESQGGGLDREMERAVGGRDQYTKNFKQGTLSEFGGPLNDMDLAGKVGDAWNASNPGPGYEANMSEQGGWIVKNNWLKAWWTGEDYSIDAWPSTSGGTIRPTAEPSDAVAAFHTHPQYELESTPETMNMGSQPGPSPGDIQRPLNVPEYVITNVSVYRLDPNGDVYSLGRSLLIQGNM